MSKSTDGRWRERVARSAARRQDDRVATSAGGRQDELRGLGELLLDGVAGVARLAEDLHTGIATRSFGASGPGGAPVRVIHDGIAGTIYAAVRGGATAARGPAGRAIALAAPAGVRRGLDGPRGAFLLGAVNGLIGDRLAQEGSAAAIRMGFRRDGRPLPVCRESLAAAFPHAPRRIVVFVHGLCETEAGWRLGGRPTYGELLQRELGVAPLYLRYNTGRHVSDNGRELSELLEALLDAWPRRRPELALVGHSMGGLVVRSACHHGDGAGLRWVRAATHVIFLGSPHLGSPVERAANRAAFAAGTLPETRFIQTFLRTRSAGIKDLRHGALTEDDWRERDLDALSADPCAQVPLLGTATHCAISGSADVFVPRASACHHGEHVRHFPRLDHIRMLNDPEVYEQLREWLRPPPASRATGRARAAARGRIRRSLRRSP